MTISLRTAATGSVTGLGEPALRALAKLQQVLPSRLRHRVTAFRSSVVPLTGAAAETVDADLLAAIAAACRDHRRIRLRHRRGEQEQVREVEPYRLVHTPHRWYLLAWDTGREDWRTFRADRIMSPLGQPGARFTPRPLPHEDAAAYVSTSISVAPYAHRARILFHAPLAEVAPHTSPTAGRLEAVDGHSCVFHAGSDSLREIAVHVAAKGFDFEVLDPPELVPVLLEVAERLRRAADGSRPHTPGTAAGS